MVHSSSPVGSTTMGSRIGFLALWKDRWVIHNLKEQVIHGTGINGVGDIQRSRFYHHVPLFIRALRT